MKITVTKERVIIDFSGETMQVVVENDGVISTDLSQVQSELQAIADSTPAAAAAPPEEETSVNLDDPNIQDELFDIENELEDEADYVEETGTAGIPGSGEQEDLQRIAQELQLEAISVELSNQNLTPEQRQLNEIAAQLEQIAVH